jgi:hypothetical protein
VTPAPGKVPSAADFILMCETHRKAAADVLVPKPAVAVAPTVESEPTSGLVGPPGPKPMPNATGTDHEGEATDAGPGPP